MEFKFNSPLYSQFQILHISTIQLRKIKKVTEPTYPQSIQSARLIHPIVSNLIIYALRQIDTTNFEPPYVGKQQLYIVLNTFNPKLKVTVTFISLWLFQPQGSN